MNRRSFKENYEKKMKRIFNGILCVFLSVSCLNVVPVRAAEGTEKEYKITDDAYIRDGGNSSRNYNFEEITKAHGNQYVGKDYKVINSKSYNNSQIIAMMKLPLPTQEEVEQNGFDTYEFILNIFKNANPENCPQTYQFFYTNDTNWSESSVTWNNKPESVKPKGTDLLFDFTIEKDFAYEPLSDEEKRIRIDISDTVEKLVSEGNTAITVFVAAKDSKNTSLMIHSKESGNDGVERGAKLVASQFGYNQAKLKELIDECDAINSADYTESSYAELLKVLNEAKNLNQIENASTTQIRNMYKKLLATKENLVSVLDPEDASNVAYEKPTRSNLDKNNTKNVTDGDLTTSWQGKFFPSFVDVDLMDTYNIRDIELYFPQGKVFYYTLYGSNDGKNYTEIYQSRSDEKKTADPDVIQLSDCEYRIIRVYIEYNGSDEKSILSEIRVHGTKTNTNMDELRTGTFEEITGVKHFDETQYAAPITLEETIENVYGIIDRTIGSEYRDWFTFEIAPNTVNDYDYFELSDVNGKIHIKGNEGLSLSTGLNYYYKNYVNVQISEQTMQVNMPEKIVPIGKKVRKETPMEVRYAFNYCTLSYTFAFFGEEEWQRENDWLALNGVNVVLDLAGQEATWIMFLMNYGYSFDEAKDWLVGPGYYAWQFMDNMEVFGGPISDGYVIDRVELARSSQRWKRSLGMETVLQGYAGMVPTDFNEYNPDVQLISQGNWNGFSRPSMIATDSADYDEMAAKFYEAQQYVYGETSDYYAVDPFHEGGKRPEGLTDDEISKEVLESMLRYDSNAVWTVQGWQKNPTDQLLEGMGNNREEHVLIVDLIKYPLVTSGEAQYKKNEFQGTSWAWCLLGNFGGNPTMNGEIETMVKEILTAKENSKHMVGIGIISEATYDNPMIYDLIFDLAWVDGDFNLNSWMNQYIERRYGGVSENAKKAWSLIKEANYNEGVRLTKELFGVRTGGVPRNIGKGNIGYDIHDLENALRLLLEDYDQLKDSEGYRYDLSEIMRQVVSNYALYKYHDVIDARDAKDLEAFRKAKGEFLNAFDVLNEVSRTQREQLAGEWIGKAQDRAANYDDFSKSAFEMNAKSLITTWGSIGGSLVDYGFRTYEGMFLDVRKDNWVEYLDQVEQNLINGSPITTPSNAAGYSRKYWKWVIGDQEYTRVAKDSPEDLKTIADRVLTECVFTGELDPNIGNVALDRETESRYIESGKASMANDGTLDTTVSISGKQPELIVDLIGEFQLSEIQIVLDGANHQAYQYELYSSIDGKEWQLIGQKEDDAVATDDGVTHDIDHIVGRYIKIVGACDTLNIKEIRAYGERRLPEVEALQRLVDYAETIEKGTNRDDVYRDFLTALEKAHAALEETSADAMNTAYWNLYDAIIDLNLSGISNVALKKPTKANNDPAGHSERLVDGSMSSKWNSGRLSIPGKPYDHDALIPGENVIDLQGLYNINELRIYFGNTSIWYNYEILGSVDGNEWVKLAEKTTQTLPNKDEDIHVLEVGQYRYIKLLTTNVQLENSGKRHGVDVSELEVYGYAAADFTQLKEKIKEVEKLDESFYTANSWATLADELAYAKEVVANPFAKQSEVTKAFHYLSNAKEKLVYKTADYHAVTEAIHKANALNKDLYKDFSNVEKALANVVNDLDITHQKEVDAMAKAIHDAISALEYKAADYSKVDAAINQVPADLSIYTDESVRALKEALNGVVRDKNITEQDEVDAMAKAIESAIHGLVKKAPVLPTDPTVPTTPEEPTVPTTPEEPTTPEAPNTGDESNIGLLISLFILSMGVMVILYNKKRKAIQ